MTLFEAYQFACVVFVSAMGLALLGIITARLAIEAIDQWTDFRKCKGLFIEFMAWRRRQEIAQAEAIAWRNPLRQSVDPNEIQDDA